MHAYIVIEYDKGPKGFEGMQALINEKAAEGYILVQATPRGSYDWVLIFKKVAE